MDTECVWGMGYGNLYKTGLFDNFLYIKKKSNRLKQVSYLKHVCMQLYFKTTVTSNVKECGIKQMIS